MADNSSQIIEDIKWFMFNNESKEIKNENGFSHGLQFVKWIGDGQCFPDEYVPELLDDEIKLPYKISRFEAKAIKLALHHEWIRDTDDNGKAISCSQEMADATYRMLSLFDKLIIESDKDEQSKEQNK